MGVKIEQTYVTTDVHGVMRVGQRGVLFDGVVIAFCQGHSAETIQDQYPSLTLEEVYGAIAHYLANREQVDRYLQERREHWDQLRREAERNPSPVVERLQQLRRSTNTGRNGGASP